MAVWGGSVASPLQVETDVNIAKVVQRCARTSGSWDPEGSAGLALFSLITFEHQKSVAA